MFDWIYVQLNQIGGWIDNSLQWGLTILSQWVTWLWNAVNYIWKVLLEFGKWVLKGAKIIQAGLIKGIKALLHLNFREIWRSLRCAYERFQRARVWWKKHVQDPIDKIRKNIMDIYRTFFQPIIRFLDSLRVFIRFIGLFNRKLAAKLDARLWGLESKILFPITYMLKRVNELSSFQRAWITTLGMLDRSLLLESLRRDASLVWEVLTNPRGKIFEPGKALLPYTYSDLHSDVQLYADTRGGPIADYIDEAHRSVREDLIGVI